MISLLLVSPKQKELDAIRLELSNRFDVETAGSLRSCSIKLQEKRFELVLLDARLPYRTTDDIQGIPPDNPVYLELNHLLASAGSLADARKNITEFVEKAYLEQALTRYSGKINRTAEATGISCRQLHKLMTKYGIRKEHFKNRDRQPEEGNTRFRKRHMKT